MSIDYSRGAVMLLSRPTAAASVGRAGLGVLDQGVPDEGEQFDGVERLIYIRHGAQVVIVTTVAAKISR
jgi:hypothetical protein